MPIGAPPTQEDNAAIVEAVRSFLDRQRADDDSGPRRYLDSQSHGAYRASLLLNLGITEVRNGAFTRAARDFEEAWVFSMAATDPSGRAVADRALAEWADLYTHFGDMGGLERVFAEAGDRELHGSAAQKLAVAKEGYWILRNYHETAVPSARTALEHFLWQTKGRDYQPPPQLATFPATHQGATLTDLRSLTLAIGEPMRIVFRESGEIPVPSIVHLNMRHYSAIVRQEGDRYLLEDPCLGGELWISRETLLEESSGYFFVPEDQMPAGFRGVDEVEGLGRRGKCVPIVPDREGPERGDPEAGGSCGRGKGMIQWGVYKLHVSVHLEDTPVGYVPARGPAVEFRLAYNQRELHQPAIFTFSNVGPLWTNDWIAYLEDDPASPEAPVTFAQPGGGIETHRGFDVSTGAFARDIETRSQLVRTSTVPVRYERRMTDGSVQVFAQADGAATSPRRIFLTELIDPQGQGITFTYDSSLRLVSITDALGQVTTLSYEGSDPLAITRVTDPFGRFATLEYDSSGRLKRVTDVLGLQSEVTYSTADFASSLETPYGQTTLTGDPLENPNNNTDYSRWVVVVDPLGGKERVEYVNYTTAVPATESIVPFGFQYGNADLRWRNTFYWDKRAMSLYPGEYQKAEITHWFMMPNVPDANFSPTATPHSIKRPLENRVWYKYPGQEASPTRVATQTNPVVVARVLDDGTTQAYSYEYNDLGSMTKSSDPLGRTALYTYAANLVDQTEVRQLVWGGAQELLRSATYNAQHQPLTVTDAAGQTTTFTYTATGQLESVTTPARAGISENRTTTYGYNPQGQLETVTAPDGLVTWSYTYDGIGRRRTTTTVDGYTLTFDYDALDRITRVTFPDGTYDETVYDRLDAVGHRDRMGRRTHSAYDALRRLVSTTDPEGRTVSQNEWLSCSSSCSGAGERLSRLLDGRGNPTVWHYDLQGRILQEVRANGTTYDYTYEATTSRLASVHDPNGSTKSFAYNADDTVRSVIYAEGPGVAETPDVSFTYDPTYNRAATMVDGTGTTSYAYHPVTAPPTLGAGKLAAIDGPLPNDTITYAYDELGRAVTRSINGAANVQATTYDLLGRPVTITNLLGTFSYSYDPASRRLVTLAYPNGQTTTYAYHPLAGDFRLREVHNKRPGGATLSRFEYTYDLAANVKTWLQQADSDPPTLYELGYDSTDQLTAAILESTGATPQILKRYYYAYDAAGNRTVEQVDDSATASTYNNMNQIASQGPGGLLTFAGSVDEPAIVTVGGAPAGAAADNTFRGEAPVSSGTSQVEVQARDYAQPPNVRTNTYEVTQAGVTRTFTFDANGNMTGDGARTFEWDADNHLAGVLSGSQALHFTYDGRGRGIGREEWNGGSQVSAERLVRCGFTVCEVRDATGAAAVRRDFRLGQWEATAVGYLATDLLGSARELTGASGEIRARFEFDPYGRSQQTLGTQELQRGFTGEEAVVEPPLMATHFRIYSPDLGRWLSEDAIDPSSGPNLYSYARNNPATFVDPDGAAPTPGEVGQLLWKFCKKGFHIGHRAHALAIIIECGKERTECDDDVQRHCRCREKPDWQFGWGSSAQRQEKCIMDGNNCCDWNFGKCLLRRGTFGLVDVPSMPCSVGGSECEAD